jgi:phosphatidylserine decarboxylase
MKITNTKKIWSIILILLAIVLILSFIPSPQQSPINYFERGSDLLKTENVAGEAYLVWLYNNPIGEATLWALAKRKVISTMVGKKMDHPSSTERIQPFIEEFNIDMSTAQTQEFSSFNDFFCRKLKINARPIDTSEAIAASPVDGKVLAYSDISKIDFIVKGHHFDIFSFLNDEDLAQNYLDGSAIILRLAPFDYHRFHFPVSGSVSPSTPIEGYYYSVNPLALRQMTEILCLNKRELTTISNSLFGDIVMVEVGATMVGTILQTHTGNIAQKGEEKGYFKFGGSTVVLLFEKNKIRFDEDLLLNTSEGYETEIKQGESIGVSIVKTKVLNN